jgi:ubiquinol-cytochrome c reductase cytochrome c1 subunit
MFSYFMTDAEIKELAAKKLIANDNAEEDGTYSSRPMKASDGLPKPYQNEREARYANGGALPPDLSNITRARHDGMNYVYALLQGYKEELPAGMPPLRAGQFFNPYFPGGIIGMPPPLSDDMLEYEDGTPATVAQMSKDVTQFLEFIFEPKHDETKKYLMKTLLNLATGFVFVGWMGRRLSRTWLQGQLTWFKNYKH